MSVLYEHILKYLRISCERVQREGNYQYHIQDVSTLTLSTCKLTDTCRIETVLRKRDHHLYYEWLIKIGNPFRISYPLRSFPFWDHPVDHDSEFEFHESQLRDQAFLIEHAIIRFGTIRYCKELTCTKLLTSYETDYCIECDRSIQPIDCSICLDVSETQPTLTTHCGHTYHTRCFRAIPASRSITSCPLCREPCHYHLG